MLFWLRKGFIRTFYFWIVWGKTVYVIIKDVTVSKIYLYGCVLLVIQIHMFFENGNLPWEVLGKNK